MNNPLLREQLPNIPDTAELDVVRHFTRLSQKNFSIETNFYPLGSCTMKYNPRAAKAIASMPGYFYLHPLTDTRDMQGYLENIYELQNDIAKILINFVCQGQTPYSKALTKFIAKGLHDISAGSVALEILRRVQEHLDLPEK